MPETLDLILEGPKQFYKDSVMLLNRCTKPDKKEFLKITQAIGVGFVIMGLIGYTIKLVHIPINNIIVYAHLICYALVPFEQARRVFRHSQRLLEQKLANMTKFSQDIDIDCTSKAIEDLIKTIQEDQIESRLYREKCHKRLKFYNELCNDSPTARDRWEKLKIDRQVVEFLLSKHYFETANSVAEISHIKDEGFDDKDLFKQLSSLGVRLDHKSTAEVLLWCFENRSHLKKSNSSLEFSLRRQTFVEFARKRDLSQAIAYAKKFFPPWLDQFRREIEQCMALLAIGPDTQVEPYRKIYDEGRWSDLKSMLKKEFLDLYSIPCKPQLISFLQAGLSTLKTPVCGHDVNLNCPVCVPPYADISSDLPYSHHENSSIVCRITGALIDGNNPPLILPNGRVYSQTALQEAATKTNGTILCPQTGETFKISDLRKVFFL